MLVEGICTYMNNKTYGFIGLGLIGGSMARAIKRSHPDCTIMAYAPHRTTVDAARADGTIDIALERIGAEFSDCDYIFLCAPVEINNDNLELLMPYLSPKTTVTDIGSVKNSIHEKVRKLGIEDQFIGGHPMTGTERIGYQNSKAALLENAYYILTKTDKTKDDRISDYYHLVKAMGAIPLVVPYLQHDYATAAISHVPHVLSAALVNLVKNNDNEDDLMKTIAAGGFKDITRIASGSPTMWQHIFLSNKDAVLKLIGDFKDELSQFENAISSSDPDEIINLWTKAKDYRDSITIPDSAHSRFFELYCDIDDKPGTLVGVLQLLANAEISVKNIDIIHNREFEPGVLRIEFYTQDALDKARTVLTHNNYYTRQRTN